MQNRLGFADFKRPIYQYLENSTLDNIKLAHVHESLCSS